MKSKYKYINEINKTDEYTFVLDDKLNFAGCERGIC